MSAPVDYPTLYSLTGDVKDINTLLVPAAQLDAIGAGGVSAPRPIPARVHVTEEMHRAAVKVLHRASGLDGLPQRMVDAMLSATPPQVAPVAWMHETPGRVDVIHDGVKKLLSAAATDYLHRPIDKSEKYTIPLYAAAQSVAEERKQLRHLLDDIVEEVEDEGCAYYRIRAGKDLLFSNTVFACARLLAAAQPVAVQRVPLTVDDLWKNDALMALNAEIGLPIQHLEEIVAVIEAAHGIKPASEGGA